jgi:hypothetical protein
MPLVVLVNRGSASASEIVAGSIQDHDRGLVIGETSWGKGLVQSVYTLQYGAGLALTTSKYYTPSGRNIQRDYSSFYDYYVADESDNGESAEMPLKDRKQFKTDTGRVVYGGGGITPDVFVKPPTLSRTTQLLEVRSAIFNYAVEYAAKHPDVTENLTITPMMMSEFERFAADKDVASVDDIEAALKKPTTAVHRARAEGGDHRREVRLRRFVSVSPAGRHAGGEGDRPLPRGAEAGHAGRRPAREVAERRRQQRRFTRRVECAAWKLVSSSQLAVGRPAALKCAAVFFLPAAPCQLPTVNGQLLCYLVAAFDLGRLFTDAGAGKEIQLLQLPYEVLRPRKAAADLPEVRC